MDALLTTGIASSGSSSSGGGNWVKEKTISVTSLTLTTKSDSWFTISSSTLPNMDSILATIAAKFPRAYRFVSSATVTHKGITSNSYIDQSKDYIKIGLGVGFDNLSSNNLSGAGIIEYSSVNCPTQSSYTVNTNYTKFLDIGLNSGNYYSSGMRDAGAFPLDHVSGWTWYGWATEYDGVAKRHNSIESGNNPTIKNLTIDIYALY